MSFRVRIKENGLADGRVSVWATSIIIKALQVALRSEASSVGFSKSTSRGRLAKLARESSRLSISRVESGSGQLVLESETDSLVDIPAQMFEDIVREAQRGVEDQENANQGIQKALLSLETLFRDNSPVEFVEFIDQEDRVGTVNRGTVERLKVALGVNVSEPDDGPPPLSIVGRLLELDLANRSFKIYGIQDDPFTVIYDDYLESFIKDALKFFVKADIQLTDEGRRSLVSLIVLDDIPESRFDEIRTIDQIVREQGVQPLQAFDDLGLEDPDPVSAEEFNAFIRSIRRGEV